MSEGTGHPPAGWYPDGRGAHRWWDGSAWTEHTGGSPGAPPPGAPPAPPPTPPPAASSPPGPSGPPPSQPPPGQSFGWQPSGAPGPRGGFPAAGGYPAAGGPGAPGGPGAWGGYASAGPPPGPPPKSRKGLLIGGVVAAVLLVVGLGVVLALTLGGSESGDDTAAPGGDESRSASADSEEPSESSEPDEPSDSDDAESSDAGGSDDPAATAVEYLEAQLDVDLVRLCELSSAEKQEIYTAGSSDGTCAGIDTGGQDSASPPGDDDGFTFVTEVTEQDEDTATVEYELDVTGDATPGESLDDPFGRLSMVLEDDQWRVDDEEFIR